MVLNIAWTNFPNGITTTSINGLNASTGDNVAFVGGASEGSGVAGGDISVTGGASNNTGAGGVASLVGGSGGTTSGAGGGARVTGGAGTGGGVGGTAIVTGGAGQGTGNGASARLIGGASGAGATGTGGQAIVTGGASFATNGSGGSVAVTGGASAGTNIGGVVTITGGASGAGSTGAGGAITLTSGAALSTNGGSGSINLTVGTSTGTGDGGSVVMTAITAASGRLSGIIQNSRMRMVLQPTPTALTTSATITAAQLATGLLTANQGGGATASYQLPTATSWQAILPLANADNYGFDFFLVNISAVAAEDVTITTNTGWTLVGNMTVASNNAVTDQSSGQFRAYRTATNTYTLVRLA